MKHKLLSAILLFPFVALVPRAFADCESGTLELVSDCVQESAGTINQCLQTVDSQGNPCSLQQIYQDIAQDALEDLADEECCSKSKSAAIKCFKKHVKATAKGKALFNSGLKNGLREEFNDEIKALKQLGTCAPSEEDNS